MRMRRPRSASMLNTCWIFLLSSDSDSVVLEFKDEMSQALFSPLSTDGCDYLYVIMPMRI